MSERDGQIPPEEPIAAVCAFKIRVRVNLGRQSESARKLVLPLLGQLPGHTLGQRGNTPRTTISRISNPTVIDFPAPESSVSRNRKGYRGSVDAHTVVVSKS